MGENKFSTFERAFCFIFPLYGFAFALLDMLLNRPERAKDGFLWGCIGTVGFYAILRILVKVLHGW